jgi:hypothetical protein
MTVYCVVEDIFDLYDIGTDMSELGTNTQFTEADVARIIETACDAFDRERGGAFRLQDTGNPAFPSNWEDHEVNIPFSHDSTATGVKNIDLEYEQVRPIDPEKGDGVELKMFYRDGYEDAVDDDRWEFASNAEGLVRIMPSLWRAQTSGRYRMKEGVTGPLFDDVLIFRFRYRYGALGGSQRAGGQTKLSQSLDDSETGEINVENPEFLPTGENKMLLDDDEYVTVDVSYTNGSLSVEILDRGARHGNSTSHDEGDVLHYCPFDVREAAAAYAAAELYDQQEFIDALGKVGGNIEFETRIDRLMEKFHSVVNDEELKG